MEVPYKMGNAFYKNIKMFNNLTKKSVQKMFMNCLKTGWTHHTTIYEKMGERVGARSRYQLIVGMALFTREGFFGKKL